MGRIERADFFDAIRMSGDQYQADHAEIFGIVEGVALPVFDLLGGRRMNKLGAFVSQVSETDLVTTQLAMHQSTRNGRLVMDDSGVFGVNYDNDKARNKARSLEIPIASGRLLWRSTLSEIVEAQLAFDTAATTLNNLLEDFRASN